MANINKYRLLTRGDLDGLVCAVLMKHLDMIDEIKLVDHPSDMQLGIVKVSDHDISTNLPYVDGVHLAIDHHFSEAMRNKKNDKHIIDPDAPSAARVVYNYYGGKKRFPDFFDDMMIGVDKADSGEFSRDEILFPKRWALLNFLIDQRTNIESRRDFRISEEQFKFDLIDYCSKMTIDEILELGDVKERSKVYFDYEEKYKKQLETYATIHGNIVVLDLRQKEIRYPGNRFVIYALYPQCNISVLLRFEPESGITIFSVGKSIVNRTSNVNIGEIMLSYGGGGHRAAGACHQDDPDAADRVFKELLVALSDKKQFGKFK
ncbi:MAG: exopolyphosphatase [Desulfobacteraceae bacterium]|nr:exopolyphosphatase [Desulfobacteraceae bacterium]MBC2755838.1 exopolyphosphatase [Desulfobacteraceae bacterium]